MRAFLLPALILPMVASLPAASQAQSLSGFDISGEIELEGLATSGDRKTLVYGDIDVSVGFGGPFGVDFGVLAYDAETSSDSAVFVALTYRTEFGKISFGAPRGAMKDFTRMPVIGGIKYFDLAIAPYSEGAVDAVALFGDSGQLGVRYDGTYGDLKVGASYHYFNDLDGSIFDLAASYKRGMYFVAGGIEYVNGSGSTPDGHIAHVEVGAEADYYSAGIGFTTSDNILDDAAMAWASYSALPNTDLTFSILNTSGETVYGLSGEWRFLNYSVVQLGVADSTSGSAVWDASIGLKF